VSFLFVCLVRLDINIGRSADIGVAEQVRNNLDISGTIKDYATERVPYIMKSNLAKIVPKQRFFYLGDWIFVYCTFIEG